MDRLEKYIHNELDKWGKRYESSFIVKDIIDLKTRLHTFLIKKSDGIRSFYRGTGTEDKISFKLKSPNIFMRITFYRSGHVSIFIEHQFSTNKRIKDNTISSEYCVDSGCVYFIESEFGWKIGKTRNITQRRKTFEVKLPFPFAVRYLIKTSHKSKLERELHGLFRNKNINGEWFLLTDEEIINAVNNLNGYKLTQYSPDENIIIEKKYLKAQ